MRNMNMNMFKTLPGRKGIQLVLGLLLGIPFGFFLQKGGITRFNVIIGQLLLTNFTFVKVMLSAVVKGMIGVHLLKSFGLATLHPKSESFGFSVIGGLIFGVGFGLLGYCPGTIAGAVGQGSLDGLFGGMAGMIVGAGLFDQVYPRLNNSILKKGDFGKLTFPYRLLK
jgi:uncharacterized membrane protein YedE/YeeE